MFTSYPFFKLCAFKDRIRPGSSKIGCVIVCDCLFLWCVSGEGDGVKVCDCLLFLKRGDVFQVRVTVFPEKAVAQYGGVPWWIILVSVLAGILMLALLVFLLWKVCPHQNDETSITRLLI